MNVVLLNGSPAVKSHTKGTLVFLEKEFSTLGNETRIVDLINFGLPVNNPIYHADAMQSDNEKVREFAQIVKDADLVVLGTPLYHGSFSGLLKSALDNLDGPAFEGKKILLCSNSSGPRSSVQASQELVIVARTMGGQVHNSVIGTCKADHTESENEFELTSDEIKTRCEKIAKEMFGNE